jgi:hypothetical protein
MNATLTFSGRVDELQLLFRGLGRAALGQPHVIFLEGAPGMGKSSLLQLFALRATHRHKASCVIHVRSPGSGRYAPVAQAAKAATNKQLYDKVGGRRKAIAAARDLLPDWVGAVPGIGDVVAAIVATVQAIRRRRRGQAYSPSFTLSEDAEALLTVAARRPLVLLLDDLQDANDAEVAELDRLIRAAKHESKLLVIGAYRPTPQGAPDPPIHRLVAALPADTAHHHKLRELTAHELHLWLRKRFPHVEVPRDFLDWLCRYTGGHPAAVEDTLTRLLQRSVIRFINRHWQIEERVDAALARDDAEGAATVPTVDLSGIRPAVVEILRAASAYGDEFNGSSLALLVEKDELYVEDQLALAAHHKLVETIGEATLANGEITTVFRFTSSHLRAVLARDLTSQDRATFARRQEAVPSGG